jgi:hypothetical protein
MPAPSPVPSNSAKATPTPDATPRAGHQRRGENRREADHRADRKIDAAGKNHQRHPQRGDAEKRIVGEETHDHARRKKPG